MRTNGTFITGVFAFRAGALELHATDTTGVVRVFREIPLPFRDGGVVCVGDFHGGVVGRGEKVIRYGEVARPGGLKCPKQDTQSRDSDWSTRSAVTTGEPCSSVN